MLFQWRPWLSADLYGLPTSRQSVVDFCGDFFPDLDLDPDPDPTFLLFPDSDATLNQGQITNKKNTNSKCVYRIQLRKNFQDFRRKYVWNHRRL